MRFLALVTLALTPLVPAMAAPPTRIADRDGYKFEYSAQLDPGGTVRIEGRMVDGGQVFHLALRESGHVDGNVDGKPVSFRVPPARRRAIVARLAAEGALASRSAGEPSLASSN